MTPSRSISSDLPSATAPQATGSKEHRKADWKRRQSGSNFVDTLSLSLHSGRGGSGGVAFHREKFKAKGPPSGGPGGAGGSVYLVATPSLTSLSHLPRTVRAGNGNPGGGKWLAGMRGDDVVLRVPVGTVVREVRKEERDEEVVEREREEREEMEWAWEASQVRLAEAEERERRWDLWKKAKDLREKGGGDRMEPFEEKEERDVGAHKQAALEAVRKDLFVTYPLADLSSHPQFLYTEQQLLSKLLSREAVIPGRKTRRRRKKRDEEEDGPLFLDLAKATPGDQPITLLTGGTPGLGNSSFQSTTDRSPKYATRGGDGETMRLELELKAAGEVGLVGMPNAGKSTLLRALTSSTPRVASYAFTTLNPHHGTCVLYVDGSFSGPPLSTPIMDTTLPQTTFSGLSSSSSAPPAPPHNTRKSESLRFTITDNPGLVPNSSLNVGLGHAFLRHVERCSALVYVVDMSGKDPVGDLQALRKELGEYSRLKGLDEGEEGLERRVRGVVANKADLFGPPSRSSIDEEIVEDNRRSTEEGTLKLKALMEYVKEVEKEEVAEGLRSEEARIWVVPISAMRRQNVEALVGKLATTVLVERERQKMKAEEEERQDAEEREAAMETLLGPEQ